jgi:hypothetical protein
MVYSQLFLGFILQQPVWVFPTILANNAKGTHFCSRVLATLYRPIIIPRKGFSAEWATPFRPSGEIFLERKLWHRKGTSKRPNDMYKNVLMSLSDLCSNRNIFPISMLFKI